MMPVPSWGGSEKGLVTTSRLIVPPRPDTGTPGAAVLDAVKFAGGSWHRPETVVMQFTRRYGVIQILVCVHFPMADMGLFFDQEIIVEIEIV